MTENNKMTPPYETAKEAVRNANMNNHTNEKVYAGPRYIAQVFGVSPHTLKKRGLKSVNGKYDLAVFWRTCSELVYEKISEKINAGLEGDTTTEDLKTQKLAEEIRKLKIDNDVKDGILVPAEDVYETYGRGIKALCDVLDAIPSRIKMQFPDVSSVMLDGINREIAESRNKGVQAVKDL